MSDHTEVKLEILTEEALENAHTFVKHWNTSEKTNGLLESKGN